MQKLTGPPPGPWVLSQPPTAHSCPQETTHPWTSDLSLLIQGHFNPEASERPLWGCLCWTGCPGNALQSSHQRGAQEQAHIFSGKSTGLAFHQLSKERVWKIDHLGGFMHRTRPESSTCPHRPGSPCGEARGSHHVWSTAGRQQ